MARTQIERFHLVGGRLCLDFCNTADAELLPDFAGLVDWSLRAGILNAEEAHRLWRSSRRSPTEAIAIHARALALRGAVDALFRAAARRRRPDSAALELLNHELGRALARSQVVRDGDAFAWVWAEGGRALDSMLWPVARSAADLLTGGELGAVRICAGRDCSRLFLDASRNRTRRWCDMRTCGNRAKARRHQARLREAGAA
jgi:predicted RNA-binding Zn ribbon-like protein